MSLVTFRDTIRRLSPPWLQGTLGERLLYAITVHLDLLVDATVEAVKARFPRADRPEFLGLIGRDRTMRRGLAETDAGYAERLPRWLDDLRAWANPYTLMRQMAAYLSPHRLRIRIVNDGGSWYTREADGATSYYQASWDWDGKYPATAYSRFWLILYPPSSLWQTDGTWVDAGTWEDTGGTFGSTATYEEAQSIQGFVSWLRAPHSYCQNIILSFDPAAFDPVTTPAPDGHWNLWSHRLGYRDTDSVYWDGT